MPRFHDDFLEWQRLHAGPLGAQLDTFAATLTAKGYTPATVMVKVHVAVEFGHWLGHESVETTQIYLAANLQTKERALAKTAPNASRPARFRPDDKLLTFLQSL